MEYAFQNSLNRHHNHHSLSRQKAIHDAGGAKFTTKLHVNRIQGWEWGYITLHFSLPGNLYYEYFSTVPDSRLFITNLNDVNLLSYYEYCEVIIDGENNMTLLNHGRTCNQCTDDNVMH